MRSLRLLLLSVVCEVHNFWKNGIEKKTMEFHCLLNYALFDESIRYYLLLKDTRISLSTSPV